MVVDLDTVGTEIVEISQNVAGTFFDGGRLATLQTAIQEITTKLEELRAWIESLDSRVTALEP